MIIRSCLGAYLPSAAGESGSRRASAKVCFLVELHNLNRSEKMKLFPFRERERERTHAQADTLPLCLQYRSIPDLKKKKKKKISNPFYTRNGHEFLK